MLKKGSKLNSIVKGLCPKCQEESMYVYNNPYTTLSILKMHEKCSHCGAKHQIEPSFFYGAMYVSYSIGVALGVFTFIVSYVFLNTTPTSSFYAIIVTLIVFMPLIMRLSRNIWINLFVNYSNNTSKQG